MQSDKSDIKIAANKVFSKIMTFSYSKLSINNEERWMRLGKKYQLSKFDILPLLQQINLNTKKTVIYRCKSFCGGLGDRLRGIVSTYFLALITDRHFMIDMSYPCHINNFFETNLYNWTLLSYPTAATVLKREIHAIDNVRQYIPEFRNTDFIKRWSYYDAVEIHTNLDFITPVFMNRYLKNNSIITAFLNIMTPDKASINTLFPLLFEILFKPSIKVTQLIDPFLEMVDEAGKSLLCLHLRVGKNPSNPKDEAFPDRRTIISDTIGFIENSTVFKSHSFSIMVVSDSSEAVSRLLHHFPNFSYTIPGPILHIDRPVNHIGHCDGFLKAVGDFYILGECHTNLLSNSRFSAFANLRRNKPYESLYKYSPKTKTVEKCDNIHLFSSWEPLKSANIAIYCPVTYNKSMKEV